MNERVMEIVNILIKIILEGGGLPETGATLVNDLLAKGYDASEIDAAFNLVFSLPQVNSGAEGAKSLPARRVLDAEEQLKLTIEAQGALELLSKLGLLSISEMDELLFYLSQIDAVGLDMPEILWLLERVVKDRDRLLMILGFDWSRHGLRARRRRH